MREPDNESGSLFYIDDSAFVVVTAKAFLSSLNEVNPCPTSLSVPAHTPAAAGWLTGNSTAPNTRRQQTGTTTSTSVTPSHINATDAHGNEFVTDTSAHTRCASSAENRTV